VWYSPRHEPADDGLPRQRQLQPCWASRQIGSDRPGSVSPRGISPGASQPAELGDKRSRSFQSSTVRLHNRQTSMLGGGVPPSLYARRCTRCPTGWGQLTSPMKRSAISVQRRARVSSACFAAHRSSLRDGWNGPSGGNCVILAFTLLALAPSRPLRPEPGPPNVRPPGHTGRNQAR